jgi:hypothetical protein
MSYAKYGWVLKFAAAGAFWFGFLHMTKGNMYQAFLSWAMIIPGLLWNIVTLMMVGISVGLVFFKFIRIYIVNALIMKFYLIAFLPSLKFINFFKTLLGGTPFDDIFKIYYPKYPEMLSMYTDYSRGILILVSLIILWAANTYLTKGISIGMTICSIYLIIMSYASKDNK